MILHNLAATICVCCCILSLIFPLTHLSHWRMLIHLANQWYSNTTTHYFVLTTLIYCSEGLHFSVFILSCACHITLHIVFVWGYAQFDTPLYSLCSNLMTLIWEEATQRNIYAHVLRLLVASRLFYSIMEAAPTNYIMRAAS